MTANLWGEGLLIFGVVFAFELVDRTNFAVLTLATRHSHRDVWVGASVAFVVSTGIAVGIGLVAISVFSGYLLYVKLVGGTILIAFGAHTLSAREEKETEEVERRVERELTRREVWLAAFSLILFLEMGDNTQILTILFVASTSSVLVVFVAASLALVSVAAVGARGGALLRTRINPMRLAKFGGAAFIAIGIGTIGIALLSQFDPAVLPPFLR